MSSPPPASSSPLWSLRSARLGIAIGLALSLAIEGLMRSNINMAMVCMVNKTAMALMAAATRPAVDDGGGWGDNNTFGGQHMVVGGGGDMPAECQSTGEDGENGTSWGGNDGGGKGPGDYYASGELVITKQEQSMIFTSFYAGGLVIILPGSYLCDWLGPTRLVFYGALLNVIGTIVTPLTIRQLGPLALATVRFLMGCGQGILVPCVNVLIAHWFPLGEKSTAIAISTTGNQVSVIVAMFLTAELCVVSWLGAWASSFYIYGLIGVFFCIAWLLLVTDYPSQCKRIGADELRLVQQEGHAMGGGGARRVNAKEVPWRRILGSLVVWSTALSSFSQNFMNVGIVVYLPTYYQNVLGMDLTAVGSWLLDGPPGIPPHQNGLMSALPFVVQLFTKILFAAIADWIKRRRLMTPTTVTKLFNLIGSIGAGLCFILLSFCDCSTPYLAIGLAVTTVGISSGFIPGYNTSVVCIAPRYTSSIASFSRLLGQIASVASPYMIGLIVVKGTKNEWQLAFWIMAAILISTGVMFQLFGSASIQNWASAGVVNTNTFQMVVRSPVEAKEEGVKAEENIGLMQQNSHPPPTINREGEEEGEVVRKDEGCLQ